MTHNEMGLLDRLAAHAPVEIPDWFEHEEPPKGFPGMPSVAGLSGQDRVDAECYLEDACDLPDHLKWFGEQVRAHLAGRRQWKLENEARRYFEWRWHYAEMMLKTRRKYLPSAQACPF
jgi:hypothetical protein